jgi:hypothetical protein
MNFQEMPAEIVIYKEGHSIPTVLYSYIAQLIYDYEV